MNILDKISIFFKTALFLSFFLQNSFLFADQYFFGCIGDSSEVKRLKNQSFELNLEDETALLHWQKLITNEKIFLLNLRDDIEFVIFGLELFGNLLTKELIMNTSDTNKIRLLVKSTTEPICTGYIDLFDKLFFVKNFSDDLYERHELILNTDLSMPRVSSLSSDDSDSVRIEEDSEEDFFGNRCLRSVKPTNWPTAAPCSQKSSAPATPKSSEDNAPGAGDKDQSLPKAHAFNPRGGGPELKNDLKKVNFSGKKIAFGLLAATTLTLGASAWRKRSRRLKRLKNISLKPKKISVCSKQQKYILNLKK